MVMAVVGIDRSVTDVFKIGDCTAGRTTSTPATATPTFTAMESLAGVRSQGAAGCQAGCPPIIRASRRRFCRRRRTPLVLRERCHLVQLV